MKLLFSPEFHKIMLAYFKVLEDFRGIFGQELKLVVGDDERINKILRRVDALVEPISKVATTMLTSDDDDNCD